MAKLGKALDSVRPLPPLWTAVDMGERWSMLDWTESIATGSLRTRAARNPGFELAARPLEAIDRNSVDWNAAPRQINGDDDEIVNILKTPLVKDATCTVGIRPKICADKSHAAVEQSPRQAAGGIEDGLYAARDRWDSVGGSAEPLACG